MLRPSNGCLETVLETYDSGGGGSEKKHAVDPGSKDTGGSPDPMTRAQSWEIRVHFPEPRPLSHFKGDRVVRFRGTCRGPEDTAPSGSRMCLRSADGTGGPRRA